MVLLQCKLCGGNIELSTDKTIGTCDCCGSSVTFPKNHSAERMDMFNRGNYFRRIGEFDKALNVFEHIIREDYTDAEAHWCCALCRFGIEYVEDPYSHEWIPTCHRASYDSFLQDIDYVTALDYSDQETRCQYEKEAVKINEVQKRILATSQSEEPYDIFICYKETDEKGERTKDSVIAQDIYNRLTENNYRVFFSRITLEQKLGVEYEPYIFAGLNSAKVMIVVGTSKENLESVWVKNEWSRFIANIKKDNSKVLIPCYANMSPYDMPDSLSRLQAYDMNKIGFVQDLVHGIGKIIRKKDKSSSININDAMSDQLKKITEQQAKSRIERGDDQFRMEHYKEAYDYYADGLATLPNDFKATYKKAMCAIYIAPDNPPIKEFEKALEVNTTDEMLAMERDSELISFIKAYRKKFFTYYTLMNSKENCQRQAQKINVLFQVQSSAATHLIYEKNLEEMLLKTIKDIDSWIKTTVSYRAQTDNGEQKITYTLSENEMASLKQSRKKCTAKYNSMPARTDGEKEIVMYAKAKERVLTKLKEELASLNQQREDARNALLEQNPKLKKNLDNSENAGLLIWILAVIGGIWSVFHFKSLLIGLAVFIIGSIFGLIIESILSKNVEKQLPIDSELIQKIQEKEGEVSAAEKEYQIAMTPVEEYRKKYYLADI